MANTTNFNWETPDDTDLVKDGAAAIRTLGSAIDTSLVDLKGGTTGQVLSKATNTDMDFTWVAQDDSNAIQNAIIDAKGDLIVGTAADTPARLAVGTNGYVLTADSAEASGIKWAAAGGGGKVLQVVQGTLTNTTVISSSSYTDVNLSASITPSAATSKIAIFIACNVNVDRFGSRNAHCGARIMRDATAVLTNDRCIEIDDTTAPTFHGIMMQNAWNYVDSPATTSAITYKLQGKQNQSVNSYWNQKDSTSTATIILMEIGA
jgi:hypothetical protein